MLQQVMLRFVGNVFILPCFEEERKLLFVITHSDIIIYVCP